MKDPDIFRGCLVGGIPAKYPEDPELADVILTLADDLCRACRISEYRRDDPVRIAKHIDHSYTIA